MKARMSGINKWCLSLIILFCSLATAEANNIKVTNCQIVRSTMLSTSPVSDIQFDISWDNSWRYGASFYDAAWVFAKFSVNNGDWKHATISAVTSAGTSTNNGTAIPSPAIDLATDSKGVFLYRNSTNGVTDNSGTFSTTAVKLQWNHQGDNLIYNSSTIAKIKVQVFAIEMVHVPRGQFYVGDGTAISGGTNSHFFDASSSGAAVKITTTAPYISNVYTGSGTAGDIAWDPSINIAGALPTSRTQLSTNFPTGYNSFYIMKYKISQGQYRDFLNTLTRSQQTARVQATISTGLTSPSYRYVMSNTAAVNYRNGIKCNATFAAADPILFYCDLNANDVPNESADGEWIACNYINWADLCAYADWAALRPMTELEYEKACRGPKTPVAKEYAWGQDQSSLVQATAITNSGTSSEGVTPSGANCIYGNASAVNGPVRSGATATATSTTRVTSGGSFYGVMDLSGNLYERPVTLMASNVATTLSIFTGLHGDGVLSTAGNANVNYWPGNNGSGGAGGEIPTSSVLGSGLRAGYWYISSNYARVSDRSYAAQVDTSRNYYCGGRLARTQ